VSSDPGALFTKFLRKHPAEILGMMGSNVEALTGQTVEVRQLDISSDELSKRFSGRQIYLFPIADHASNPLNALLALDFSGAVHTGASFSLMGAEQVKEVLKSKDVPEILHDSIGEVANILCGAVLDYVRENSEENPEFRRGDTFELIRPGPWPDLLSRIGSGVDWQVIGGELLLEGEEKGALLLAAGEPKSEQDAGDQPAEASEPGEAAASGGPGTVTTPPATGAEEAGPEGAAADSPAESARQGSAPADTPAAGGPEPESRDTPSSEAASPGPPPASSSPQRELSPSALQSLRVVLACRPADPMALDLKEQLARLGVSHVQVASGRVSADVAIVISRSATDLEARIRAIAESDAPPALVVAASDLPKPELVKAASKAGVGGFLVLPASSAQLKGLLARVPEPAAAG
jgi:hypothetical protein